MNRIDIVYGGKPYSISGRSLESVQIEIDEALASGVPSWLRVNSGEGRFEDAYLLIAPGMSVALVNVKPNGENQVSNGVAAEFDPESADYSQGPEDDSIELYDQD